MPVTLRTLLAPAKTVEDQAFELEVLFALEGQGEQVVVTASRKQRAGLLVLLLVDQSGQLADTAALAKTTRVAQHHHLLGQRMVLRIALAQGTFAEVFAADSFKPGLSFRAVKTFFGVATQIAQYGTRLNGRQLVLVAEQHHARMRR